MLKISSPVPRAVLTRLQSIVRLRHARNSLGWLGLRSLLLASALTAASASPGASVTGSSQADLSPPQPLREFRGVWVASVGNIDWPSQKGLSTAEQQAELIAILNRASQLKLNAVLLQVRPACDALYDSKIEPWSEYLTGTMGRAPQPYYDPLAFAIAEAHKRGLELHAWFNPYRARVLAAGTLIAPNHISRARAEWVRHYGKFLWLDPGEKKVQDYSLNVILDVVRRYDVDGVHFDDYFYPYKEKDAAGKEIEFPDDATWRRYGAGGKLDRADWRRDNVNRFVERVYRSIKSVKPWVRFGISPFGIWRPGNPPQIRGLDAYASLYADSRQWLANGWVDYLAPQLYWSIDVPETSFPVLLQWWAHQNPRGRLLAPGLDTTKVGSAASGTIDATRRNGGWKPEEIANQIHLTRRQPGVGGTILWDMKTLMRDQALAKLLQGDVYQQPALVPAARWLGGSAPGRPRISVTRAAGESQWQARWTSSGSTAPWLWLCQTRLGHRWTTQILPATKTWLGGDHPAPDLLIVTAVDRKGNLSSPAAVNFKTPVR